MKPTRQLFLAIVADVLIYAALGLYWLHLRCIARHLAGISRELQPRHPMNLLKTIQTNLRDILVGLAIIIVVAFTADVVEKLATTTNGLTWLTNLTAALAGMSRFFTANLICWIGLAVAWPTVNHFSNHRFSDAWNYLSAEKQFWAFLVIACVMGIMAAICVAGIQVR